jgi:hypothetical protein
VRQSELATRPTGQGMSAADRAMPRQHGSAGHTRRAPCLATHGRALAFADQHPKPQLPRPTLGMRTGLIVRAGEPVKTRQLNAGERANMLFRLLPMIGTALSIGMVLGTVLSHT